MEFKTQFISREDRRIARQSLSGKHGFQAMIRLEHKSLSVSLTDFSSLGFAISVSKEHADDLKVGGKIEVLVSPLIHHEYLIK
ncbi:hypothetical protein, partial [Oleiphilus sp. HI0128]